jgi:anti-sigma28 factor (negative regulator of flagellin synthesis)
VKINDTRASVPLKPESSSTAVGKGVSQNTPQTESKGPSSGVNIDVNPSLVQSAQAGAASALSETEALEEIRRLIEKGEYKIDFSKVSESILRDSLAAIGNKKF